MKKIELPENYVIPIRVTDEDSLYDSFDPSGERLSTEISGYIDDCAEDRRIGEDVSLEVTAECQIDEARFEKAYRAYIEKRLDRNVREHTAKVVNSIRMFFIGVVFIVAGITLSSIMDELLYEIISVLGSLPVWEAAAIWLEEIPENRRQGRVLLKMKRAKIHFSGRGGTSAPKEAGT